jgi:hypothetical protein
MPNYLSQVVNAGLLGEPEHILFQILETKQKIELDEITQVYHNGELRNPNMPDDMKYVLDHMGHRCYIKLTNLGEKILILE